MLVHAVHLVSAVHGAMSRPPTWMGSTHFLMKTLKHVPTEVSLHVLAYNLKRLMSILDTAETMKAMRLARA